MEIKDSKTNQIWKCLKVFKVMSLQQDEWKGPDHIWGWDTDNTVTQFNFGWK